MTTIVTEDQIVENLKKSKHQRLLEALKRGEKLTGLEIWRRFGLKRESSAIYKFRKRGYIIDCTMEKDLAKGSVYGRYHMVGKRS